MSVYNISKFLCQDSQFAMQAVHSSCGISIATQMLLFWFLRLLLLLKKRNFALLGQRTISFLKKLPIVMPRIFVSVIVFGTKKKGRLHYWKTPTLTPFECRVFLCKLLGNVFRSIPTLRMPTNTPVSSGSTWSISGCSSSSEPCRHIRLLQQVFEATGKRS